MLFRSCESMSNLGSSNVDNRLTSGNQAEFFSKSGLTACAAGAAAGVGACLLSGTDNAALCSTVAAVASYNILMDDKSLWIRYQGKYYFPLVNEYNETVFGGDFDTPADYLDPLIRGNITSNGNYC